MESNNSNNNTCLVFNFLLRPVRGSALPPLSCYRYQKSSHLSVFPPKKKMHLQNRSYLEDPGEHSSFISSLRRANSKTITRKMTQMENKITTGWMSQCGGKAGTSSNKRWRSCDQFRGGRTTKECLQWWRQDAASDLLYQEGEAGRRAFVRNGGALERTWEQTLVHSQIYSQLTGL